MRRLTRQTLWLLLLIAVVAAGCASGASVATTTTRPVAATAAVTPTDESTPTPSVAATAPPQRTDDVELAAGTQREQTGEKDLQSPLAGLVRELDPAPIGVESLSAERSTPTPTALRIEGLALAEGAVAAVGVNEDLTFEVPDADEVGWYRFGPSPGESGSAVLAAHIAYDGIDGVFRYLADAEIGSVVEIEFDDGTTARYRIDSINDYLKDELPDSLFRRQGPAQLALITCGGAFHPELRSYDSNTVAIATPLPS